MNFIFFSILTILLWGAYPAAVNFSNPESILSGAATVFLIASLGWLPLSIFPTTNLKFIRKLFIENTMLVLMSSILLFIEITLFFLAIKESPEIATIVFEVWVISFFLTGVIFNNETKLDKRIFIFLICALIGVAIATIEPDRFRDGQFFLKHYESALLSLVAAAAMGVKSYLNSSLAQKIINDVGLIRSSIIPHLLSAPIPIIAWVSLYLFFNGNGNILDINMAPVGLIYIVGVPVFIMALQLRPNDASTGVFYFIPIVALIFLWISDVTELNYNFFLGAFVVCVSNFYITYQTKYVSSAGISAIATFILGYLSITLQGNTFLAFSGATRTDFAGAVEALIAFYGILFGFMVSDMIQQEKQLREAFYDLGNIAMLSKKNNANLYKQIIRNLLNTEKYKKCGFISYDLRSIADNEKLQNVIITLDSAINSDVRNSTPYFIFRMLSLGFVFVIFGFFGLSGNIEDRLVALLVISVVIYFLAHSRQLYFERIIVPSRTEEILHYLRRNAFSSKFRKRQQFHFFNSIIFMISLLITILFITIS